jgi:hypothetical protein
MSKSELNKRQLKQKFGIKKRFPQLPDDIIQSTWSGIVSRTRNSSQIFEKIDDNIFVAGCYNGSGIGVGTLFGEQIAIKASNETTQAIEVIEQQNQTQKYYHRFSQKFVNYFLFLKLFLTKLIG